MIEDLKARIEFLQKNIEQSQENYNKLMGMMDNSRANHNALVGRLEEAKTLLEMAEKQSANEENGDAAA